MQPLKLLLISLSLALTLRGAGPAHSAEDPAYAAETVKAAYLHRFAAYVQWPATAPRDEPFTIGVLGSDAVLEQLQRLLPSINVDGRPARARPVKDAAGLAGLSVLYIASGRLAAARTLMKEALAQNVLVVTDEPNGLRAGGAINFVRMGSNVRFEVSQPAADRAGLQIDAALLAVAARVETR